MSRFLITAIVVVMASGCAGAAPTPSPTATRFAAATAAPTATLAPTATPAPTATTETTATAAPDDAIAMPTTDSLEPGRYFVEFGGYRFTFTAADAGWSADVGAGGVYQGEDNDLAVFWPGGVVSRLYSDPCAPGSAFDPGPSVDELANALASLDGFETTAPADATVSGYHGKRVAITVPMDVDVRSFECGAGKYSLNLDRWFQASGQTDDIRILDLDGERQTVTTSNTPETAPEISAQLDALVETLVIEPI
jgi:hypothetical protein